jgi:hypothetical protein
MYMSYIFNKTNLGVVVVLVIIFIMSINEIAQFTKKLKLENQAAYAAWTSRQDSTFRDLESCQRATKSICTYEDCSIIPSGQTFDEACGKDFKPGWKASDIVIPELYKNISSFSLAIDTAESQGLIRLDPQVQIMTYASTSGIGDTPRTQTKTLLTQDITFLTNKFISYEFDRLTKILPRAGRKSGQKTYTLSFISSTSKSQTPVEYSTTCIESQCHADIIDLKNEILRLWTSPITEEL